MSVTLEIFLRTYRIHYREKNDLRLLCDVIKKSKSESDFFVEIQLDVEHFNRNSSDVIFNGKMDILRAVIREYDIQNVEPSMGLFTMILMS